jgi:hypothetical protein
MEKGGLRPAFFFGIRHRSIALDIRGKGTMDSRFHGDDVVGQETARSRRGKRRHTETNTRAGATHEQAGGTQQTDVIPRKSGESSCFWCQALRSLLRSRPSDVLRASRLSRFRGGDDAI